MPVGLQALLQGHFQSDAVEPQLFVDEIDAGLQAVGDLEGLLLGGGVEEVPEIIDGAVHLAYEAAGLIHLLCEIRLGEIAEIIGILQVFHDEAQAAEGLAPLMGDVGDHLPHGGQPGLVQQQGALSAVFVHLLAEELLQLDVDALQGLSQAHLPDRGPRRGSFGPLRMTGDDLVRHLADDLAEPLLAALQGRLLGLPHRDVPAQQNQFPALMDPQPVQAHLRRNPAPLGCQQQELAEGRTAVPCRVEGVEEPVPVQEEPVQGFLLSNRPIGPAQKSAGLGVHFLQTVAVRPVLVEDQNGIAGAFEKPFVLVDMLTKPDLQQLPLLDVPLQLPVQLVEAHRKARLHRQPFPVLLDLVDVQHGGHEDEDDPCAGNEHHVKLLLNEGRQLHVIRRDVDDPEAVGDPGRGKGIDLADAALHLVLIPDGVVGAHTGFPPLLLLHQGLQLAPVVLGKLAAAGVDDLPAQVCGVRMHQEHPVHVLD